MANNLVPEPLLDSVGEAPAAEEERSSSCYGSRHGSPVGQSMEGKFQLLSDRFVRVLEEFARSGKQTEVGSPNHQIYNPNPSFQPPALGTHPHINPPLAPTHGGDPWGTTPVASMGLRLKIPDFDGSTEVEEWLLRVTRYFNYYDVPEGDRVRVCSVQMKGAAAYWFDWLSKIRGGIMSWEEFCQAIKLEFTDHVTDLKLLKQDGTVPDCNARFQKLSKRIQGTNEACPIRRYIGGLKEEVRYEVQIASPPTLPAAVQLARLYEAEMSALGKSCKNNTCMGKGVSSLGQPPTQANETAKKSSYAPTNTTHTSTISPSDQEPTEGQEILHDEDASGTFAIPLQALSCVARHSTMKLRGTLHGKPVLILVGSGSTHSFIDSKFGEG
ncbi:uncharacterized protein M6B38_109360 [Iris pallida]|uniref:Ty3 transposon capsid-like protein domain-containing protein n=1 Tax=Iris pallida TaxID=29817 RepID=A0AAX6EGL2_IRIPA|nr:uncharacterized protein M6B38_109360 [Iris pallida]